MERKRVLQTAIDYTCGERDDAYGPPHINMGCIGEMFAVYKKYAGDKHTVGHDACILQVLTKVGRIACGKLKDDNYIDLAAYAGMAYECDMKSVSELNMIDERSKTVFEQYDAVGHKQPETNEGVESLREGVKGAAGYTASAFQSPSGLLTQFYNSAEEMVAAILEPILKGQTDCPCDVCSCGSKDNEGKTN